MTTMDSGVGVATVAEHEWPFTDDVTESFTTRVRYALEKQRAIYQEPVAAAERVLADILAQTTDTEFGREFGLRWVRDMTDWRKAVPIQQYEDIRPYVDRAMAGRDAVLTVDRPYAFLRTSGSSGTPKYIPTTRHWRDRYRGSALYAQWGLYFEAMRRVGTHPPDVLDLSWERSDVAGPRPDYSISSRPAAVSARDWLPPWYGESWFLAEPGEDWRSGLYRKLRLMASRNVRAIVALNPSKIISLAETLAGAGELLIRDLIDGTLDGRRRPDVFADREVADRLRAAQRRGPLRLRDLWPDLAVVVSWNSASAALYENWLESVLPGVPRLPFSATGTEGIVTIPVDDHPSAGPLAVNQGVFEFVPNDEADSVAPDAATLDFTELEVGGEYRLVMSQANGLLRYDIGDVYTVSGRYGATPRLEFSGRAGFRSSFTGEKLTEVQVHQAVSDAFPRQHGIPPLFTFVPEWGAPPRYRVVLQGPIPFDSGRFAQDVDDALRRINIEYGEKRRSERLGAVRAVVVEPDAFSRIEEHRRANGASSAQIKHHWLQRDDALLTTLRDLRLILVD